jgi:hypothetical protein
LCLGATSYAGPNKLDTNLAKRSKDGGAASEKVRVSNIKKIVDFVLRTIRMAIVPQKAGRGAHASRAS